MLDAKTLRLIQYVLFGVLDLVLLYMIFLVYASGNFGIAIIFLGVLALANIVYMRHTTTLYSYRFMFPGLLTFGIFVILPLVYTIYISFTNYSGTNLQTFDDIWKRYFSKETFLAGDTVYTYEVYRNEGSYYLRLIDKADETRQFFVVGLPLGEEIQKMTVLSTDPEQPPEGEKLGLKELIQLRNELDELRVPLPDGSVVRKTSLREFKPQRPRYALNEDDTMTDLMTGELIKPDFATGYYRNAKGEKVGTGFRVNIGADNYTRIFTDDKISGPFFKVFLWTIVFSAGTVFFSLVVGMVLAVLLNWKELKYRNLYRTLYILPYAIPAFISILVFRGLFNTNFGEINFILEALFGFKAAWFETPLLAKVMILIVNTWLTYPYMMILCSGIMQSISTSIYEASAIDGATPLDNFFLLTAPLIIKPLIPMLVGAFAFAFNNFVIIYLLTGGGPNMLNANTPVGETDILVSYTYRLAFGSAETSQFGFASAIATIIFILVVGLSVLNLKLAGRKEL